MSRSWFGVKTLYRLTAEGSPDRTDRDYDAQATLVEERVVVFKARSFAEAIRKAEKEARAYAHEVSFENLYGQRVRMKYLGYCNAFEMYDPPAAGVEVYSATEVVSKADKDSAVVSRKMGEKEGTRKAGKRKKFFDRELAEKFNEAAAAGGEI